jgi:hypothetical protein
VVWVLGLGRGEDEMEGTKEVTGTTFGLHGFRWLCHENACVRCCYKIRSF